MCVIQEVAPAMFGRALLEVRDACQHHESSATTLNAKALALVDVCRRRGERGAIKGTTLARDHDLRLMARVRASNSIRNAVPTERTAA